MKTTLAILMVALCTGCASRIYETTAQDGTKVRIRSTTFLVFGQVQGLDANGKGVKIGAGQSQTEAEKIAPILESVMAGAVKGLKMSGGIP